jgi:hypothetical protein
MKAPTAKTTRAALDLLRDPRVDRHQPLEKLASKLDLIEHPLPPVSTTGGEPLGTTLDKFFEGLRLFVPQRSSPEGSARPSILEALLICSRNPTHGPRHASVPNACLAPESLASMLTIRRQGRVGEALSTAEASQEGGGRLNILDFGAGEGRFARMLAENPVLACKVTYRAMEKDPARRVVLKEQVDILRERSPDSVPDPWFLDDLEGLRLEHHPEVRNDRILLCNVLHEIDPAEWASLFAKLGSSLTDDGTVLILEDQEMPVGELANLYGFLLLGKAEFGKLFNIPLNDLRVHTSPDPSYASRLLAIAIPRDKLAKCDVGAALDNLERRVLLDVRRMRSQALGEKKGDARAGRRMALLSQLAINARIALEQMGLRAVE